VIYADLAQDLYKINAKLAFLSISDILIHKQTPAFAGMAILMIILIHNAKLAIITA